MGAMILHGPHQPAQKSMTTSLPALSSITPSSSSCREHVTLIHVTWLHVSWTVMVHCIHVTSIHVTWLHVSSTVMVHCIHVTSVHMWQDTQFVHPLLLTQVGQLSVTDTWMCSRLRLRLVGQHMDWLYMCACGRPTMANHRLYMASAVFSNVGQLVPWTTGTMPFLT